MTRNHQKKQVQNKDVHPKLLDNSTDSNPTKKGLLSGKIKKAQKKEDKLKKQLKIAKAIEQDEKDKNRHQLQSTFNTDLTNHLTDKFEKLGNLKSEFANEIDEIVNKRREISKIPYLKLKIGSLGFVLDTEDNFNEVVPFPKRPKWKSGISKTELERNESTYFDDFLTNLNNTYPQERLNRFEQNLEVWRQLWRVMERSEILLLLADIRYPRFNFPPALYHYITTTLKKPFILVLTKIDLVPQSLVDAWIQWFQLTFPLLHVIPFSSHPISNINASNNNILLDKKNAKRKIKGGSLHLPEPAGIQQLEIKIKELSQHLLTNNIHSEVNLQSRFSPHNRGGVREASVSDNSIVRNVFCDVNDGDLFQKTSSKVIDRSHVHIAESRNVVYHQNKDNDSQSEDDEKEEEEVKVEVVEGEVDDEVELEDVVEEEGDDDDDDDEDSDDNNDDNDDLKFDIINVKNIPKEESEICNLLDENLDDYLGILEDVVEEEVEEVEEHQLYIDQEGNNKEIDVTTLQQGKPTTTTTTINGLSSTTAGKQRLRKQPLDFITIGILGHPNAGKSSFINALARRKVVSVSKTPGHTKHLQTIFINPLVRLCDCPGLVFPTVDSPLPLQVIFGCINIAQVRETYSTLAYVGARVPLEKVYKLQWDQVETKPPTTTGMAGEEEEEETHSRWSGFAIAEAWAAQRGYFTSGTRLDTHRAGNEILRDIASGRVLFAVAPPPPILDIR